MINFWRSGRPWYALGLLLFPHRWRYRVRKLFWLFCRLLICRIFGHRGRKCLPTDRWLYCGRCRLDETHWPKGHSNR